MRCEYCNGLLAAGENLCGGCGARNAVSPPAMEQPKNNNAWKWGGNAADGTAFTNNTADPFCPSAIDPFSNNTDRSSNAWKPTTSRPPWAPPEGQSIQNGRHSHNVGVSSSSVTLGIIGIILTIVTMLFPIGIILGIAAIVTSQNDRRVGKDNTTMGLVLGIVSLVMGLGGIAIIAVFISWATGLLGMSCVF